MPATVLGLPLARRMLIVDVRLSGPLAAIGRYVLAAEFAALCWLPLCGRRAVPSAADQTERSSAYVRASEAFKAGDYVSALSLLREHLAQFPHDIPGHFALGMSAAESGDQATTEREFRWVLQASP